MTDKDDVPRIELEEPPASVISGDTGESKGDE